ncbi:MAG: transketolase [Kiritimatiellae bacterium]|nr:transketolase [Kiritimatiellia bacterium]
MKTTDEQLKLAADTIRCLCADIVEKANSGHPGAAMGMADLAVTLWLRHLRVDPKDTAWKNRDRLVFSGGHASALVYALTHLSGTGGLTMEELQTFRQFGSRCAGHPERGVMPGVEVTTGPLGQGFAMAVGLAIGAKMKKRSNRTWVFCGDGDMEEGISHEAASLAGTLRLGGLTAIYDFNDIQIEGHVTDTNRDDAKKRFQAYGWKVMEIDGHDFVQIQRAFLRASKEMEAPVLIIAKTVIGKGAPTKAGTHGCHGAPLGAEEVAATKKALGFDPEKSFFVPQEVYDVFAARAALCHRWRNMDVKAEKEKAKAQPAPAPVTREQLLAALPKFDPEKPIATRAANGAVMNALADVFPNLVGGSADLEGSNKTGLKKYGWISAEDFTGRNFHWGVRELAMSAMVNGLTAYEDFRAFGATFFVFSDYCRPAIRLAAIMDVPSIFVFSHDSFYVGEDGPTHEPIEQIAAIRTMPNVLSFRPADANETGYAWVEMLLNTKGPSCILTTRQNLPVLEGTSAEGVAKGAYVIWQAGAQTKDTVLFLATGSEVALCIEAAKRLWDESEGRQSARVVSMPSVGLFLSQPCQYRDFTVPDYMTRRVIVEAGSRFGWDRFRLDYKTTRFVTKDDFGASGPYKVLAKEFGFTVENVYAAAKSLGAGVDGVPAGLA